MTNAASPLAWLETHGAQGDVIDGLRAIAGDWETLTAKCPRGDWLLGIGVRAGVDPLALGRASLACARIVEAMMGPAAQTLLDTAGRFFAGQTDADEVARATTGAEVEAPRDPAGEAAARAAIAVGWGVREPELFAAAPAAAVEASALGAVADPIQRIHEVHLACARAVRDAIPWAEWARALGR